jgi:hypothetical protein
MNSFKNQHKGGMHPLIKSKWYREGDHVRAKGKFIQMTTEDLIKTESGEGTKKTIQFAMPPCICGIPDYFNVPNTILVVLHPKLGIAPAYVEVAVGEDIFAEFDTLTFSEKEVKSLKWIARFYEVI